MSSWNAVLNSRPSRETTTTTLLSLGVVTATSVLAFFVYSQQRRSRSRSSSGEQHQKKKNNKDHNNNNTSGNVAPLPSHIERDMHKEERRKRMLPVLSMKKPMYDNILMQDPHGVALCTISLKKAHWYLKRNLADWVDDDDDKNADNNNDSNHNTIRLRFTPNKRIDQDQALYFVSEKANRCVVCGANQHYMRFYVVPFCYRTLFPESYKTHLSHDVVLTCADCHVRAEQATQRRRQQLEDALRADPSTAASHILDREKQAIQRAASALLKRRDRLPTSRIVEIETKLRDWFQLPPPAANNDDDEPLPRDWIVRASELECYAPNPRYIPGPELVVKPLLQKSSKRNDDDDDEYEALSDFIKGWRAHFLETQRPRFFPAGWSIDSPVQCDKRHSNEK